MGMYDELRCKYPLPVAGANERTFQTKDTPAQYLDHYEIREDGMLWHENYDIEDRSDPNAVGLSRFCGSMTRVGERWEKLEFTGEIRFYDFPTGDHMDGGWMEFSAYFVNGQIRELHIIENTPPQIAAN